MINKFWKWFVFSSANPAEAALTAKGIISSVVPIVLVFIHNPNLNDLPDSVYAVVVAVFTAYSAVATAFGLLRKIYFSLTA